MTVGLSKTSLTTLPFLKPSSKCFRLDFAFSLLSILDSNFLLRISVKRNNSNLKKISY